MDIDFYVPQEDTRYMSEYEPTQADLDDLEMSDFDTDPIDDSDAWVDSILAGLSGKDY